MSSFTPGEEADGDAQQGAPDGVRLLRSEPLRLFAGERLGGDPVHVRTAPFPRSGEHKHTHALR